SYGAAGLQGKPGKKAPPCQFGQKALTAEQIKLFGQSRKQSCGSRQPRRIQKTQQKNAAGPIGPGGAVETFDQRCRYQAQTQRRKRESSVLFLLHLIPSSARC